MLGALLLAPGLVWARVPTDPAFGEQEKFYRQIGAPEAWDYATGSSKVVVALIDTGADTWHSDLEKNIWTNPYEIDGNGVDDDNNGFIDDMHGWNFVENNNNVRPSVFENRDDPEAIRHGTIIAGIVGSLGDNGVNGAGLNWRVKIMPIRAVDSHGSGSYSDLSQAVVYAVKNGANVIGMSLVGEEYENLKNIMRWAYDQGVVLVAAAGNNRYYGEGDLDKYPVYPACLDSGDDVNWILGVTAVNANDQLSSFADYGSCVDMAAPGEKIYSIERYAPDYGFKNSFGGPWRGTSFAVPFVAGTAALIKSLHLEWSARQIISVILNNGDDISGANKELDIALPRRLNVAAAVKQAFYSYAPKINYQFGLQGSEVWVATGTEKIFFAGVSDARLAGLAFGELAGGWKPEVAILLERKPFWYVRLLKNDGSFWREFSLKNSKGAVVTKIAAGQDENGAPNLVISKYVKKTGETVWEEYSLAGALLRGARLKGQVSEWQVLSDGSGIKAQIKVKKKLTDKAVKWYNN